MRVGWDGVAGVTNGGSMNNKHVTYRSLADFAAWELEAYADGVEIPHLAQFLAEHPAEAAAWQRQQQELAPLQTALYRFDCPTPDQLQDYHWQQLSAGEQAHVQGHVQHCPHCQAELSELRSFLAPPKPVKSTQPAVAEAARGWEAQLQGALEQFRLVVANLLTPPTPQLAGVALRGDSDPASSATPQSLFFEAEETAISLLIQKEITGTLLLSGQLLTIQTSSRSTVKLIPQALDTTPTAVEADAIGNFTFPQLHPGSYQLQITLEDQLIVIPTFRI